MVLAETRHWPAAFSGRRGFAKVTEKEPEYASGDLSGYEIFHDPKPFVFRNGAELPELRVAYETWGTLNARKDNVILLQCGMSASSHARSHEKNPARGWWEDFIGPGLPLDTNIFYVICTNNLGGCFGSSGPSTLHPKDGKRYGSRFPRFEVQDQVAVQFHLLDHLGIDRVHACVGASLGGMQSVCSAANFPDRVSKFVSISAAAKSFPGSMAFRHTQRQAIMLDPHWNGGDYYEGPLPASGLRLAREIGTITYRSGQEWQQRFGQRRARGMTMEGLEEEFEIERYLKHQGAKWVNNYDPNSMLWISKAMDGFSLEKPDREGAPCLVTGLLPARDIPALVIGVQHDVLFPVWQQKQIADVLRATGSKVVTYYELDSIYGHDAFLLDAVSIGPAVKGHLEQEPGGAAHFWQDMAETSARFLQAMVSKGCSAEALRDMWRALAQGHEVVDAERLKAVVKLVYDTKLPPADIDRAFEEVVPSKQVRLEDLSPLRKALLDKEGNVDVYLP